MENVKKWFEEYCEKSDHGKNIIKQVILSLTENGFNESLLSNWIDSELESAAKVVSSKFKNDENAKD